MAVSLSIEGNSLRILSSSGKGIDKWDSVDFEPELVREGSILNIEAMAQVIKDALAERELPFKNVRWALPSIGVTSSILTLPSSKKTKLENAIEREARKVMSVSPETSNLYWQMLPGGEEGQKVYAVAIPKEMVQNLIKTCQIAGVTMSSIDLKALALARAVKQDNAIIAHGEMNSVEMIIMLNAVPGLMRGIWLREKDLDTGRLTALLLQQLASTIEYYNDMNRANPLSTEIPIYLTGEATLNPELTQRVSTLSGRTVAEIESPLSCPEHFPVPLYMTNIGLLLKSS